MGSDERWHGTRHGYDLMGCRCVACRACNADRVARWRRARKLGQRQPHPWRDRVMSEWGLATEVWLAEREVAGNGWATETAEFEESHPAPRFHDFLVSLATISR